MNKKTFIILTVVLVVIGFFTTIAFVGTGQQEDERATVTFVGPEGATIYIGTSNAERDVEPRSVETTDSYEYDVSVEPGDVGFIASRGEDFYPWEKTLTLSGVTETRVYPLMLPEEPERDAIDESAVNAAFAKSDPLPTSADPRLAQEDGLAGYIEDQAVIVEWNGAVSDMPEFFCPGENVADCLVQQVVSFADADPVEHIAFFGQEDQFLILDRGSSIVVIEIDRRGRQNIQPLYEGTAPAFRVIEGDVYVSDSGETWRILIPGYTE